VQFLILIFIDENITVQMIRNAVACTTRYNTMECFHCMRIASSESEGLTWAKFDSVINSLSDNHASAMYGVPLPPKNRPPPKTDLRDSVAENVTPALRSALRNLDFA